jgi:hypothetical protein
MSAYSINATLPVRQYCGSVTFWCESGSADSCLCLMYPDPAIFVINLQDANKKLQKVFLLITVLFEGHLHNFSKIKSQKEVTER